MTPRLEAKIDGNDAGETILFFQGWPDDASLWDEAVAALAPTYRCVRTTLPNYDGSRSERWGHTTDEMVDALAELLRETAKTSKDKKVTLVMHDWGSYWGHPVHHRLPELVSRVVSVDVAPHFNPSAVGRLGIGAYQSWLFWAFVLGGAVGSWMTRRFATLFDVPNARTRKLDAEMNYPYRNVWADLITNRQAKLTKGYWPTCPLLFIYGEKKPFAFHSEAWTSHVEKTGGKVIGLPSNHWVMNDPAFTGTLVRWLAATAPAS